MVMIIICSDSGGWGGAVCTSKGQQIKYREKVMSVSVSLHQSAFLQ